MPERAVEFVAAADLRDVLEIALSHVEGAGDAERVARVGHAAMQESVLGRADPVSVAVERSFRVFVG